MADTFWIRFCRGLNYFTAFLVVTYYGAAFLATIFECTPVDKMWYPNKPGTCINKSAIFYATGSVSVITSLLVISTPLPILFIVRRRRTEVTQLLGLILLGLVDTTASVVRMFTLASAAASMADFSCK
jgi:archaellum biogenesis protein FlaJ (TadC family)